MGQIARPVVVALMVLAVAVLPAAAQSVSPKPRSSASSGLEMRNESMVSGGTLYGDGGGSSSRPAAAAAAGPATGQAPAGGPSAAVVDQSDGGVRINGNTTSNATGTDLNSSSVGQGNSGCNTVGSISGRKC